VHSRGLPPLSCRICVSLEGYSGQENTKGASSGRVRWCRTTFMLIGLHQQLNRLNVSLFTPSLLFSKVAFFLSPGSSLSTCLPARAHNSSCMYSEIARAMDHPHLFRARDGGFDDGLVSA
ncbi:unnamed protein product, partial [Mycena citricolor]